MISRGVVHSRRYVIPKRRLAAAMLEGAGEKGRRGIR